MTDPTAVTRPLRLALIGAGIYARDAHVPSLLNLPELFQVVAVYSRTEASARARIDELQPAQAETIDLYTDLNALLKRRDVDAVDIVLPIPLLPSTIEQAFAAGKHVISEKPIAPDVTTGQGLLATYARYAHLVWMVAENWSYETAYQMAREIIQSGDIGPIVTCHWALHLPITPANKYYNTAWRRAGTVPGGWIMDGGVHHVAVLRALMGEITQVSAVATSNAPDLQPPDTLAATLRFVNGVLGSYLVSYAVKAAWPPELFIAGEQGSLRIDRGQLILSKAGAEPRTILCRKFDGVERELVAFANSIRTGAPHLNLPADRLRDVAVVEALLRSAQEGYPVALDGSP